MSRLFLVLLAPLAIGLVACNPFAAPADGVPDSLSDGDRERIAEVVRDFFFGVDEYNPQVAGEVMLPVPELGAADFTRMVLQIGALDSADLSFEFTAVEAATVDAAAGVVRARASTGLGGVDLELARRGGNWRVVRAPDLEVPMDLHPHPFLLKITNTYLSEESGRFVVVGELEHVGTTPWLVFGVGGVIEDGDGRAIVTEVSDLVARPFVDPGERLPFRLDLPLPEGVTFDESAFRVIPNLRGERGADRDILATALSVEPPSVDGTPSTIAAAVRNDEDQLRTGRVYGYVESQDGTLLSVYQSDVVNVSGRATASVTLGGPDPSLAADTARVRLETWGVVPQGVPQG